MKDLRGLEIGIEKITNLGITFVLVYFELFIEILF